MEEYNSNNLELDEADKKIFEEIKRLAEANNAGETIKSISHTINGYLHKALLAAENLQGRMRCAIFRKGKKRTLIKLLRILSRHH